MINFLLNGVKVIEIVGKMPSKVSSVCIDSRQVAKGSLFVAIRGYMQDGHSFIRNAVNLGGAVIVCEVLPSDMVDDVCYVKVKDSAAAASIIASNFYDNPSSKMRLVGVTGTNGKTTTVTLLYNLFTSLGYCCGLLSTVQNIIGKRVLETDHTTPDPITLNRLMAEMVECGCEFCFMEVSSHAADQKRIAGLTFAGGIFSNITHDHLDYHKTFVNYIAAKKSFFTMLSPEAFALTNVDDRNGMIMVENTKAKVFTYGVKEMADFHAKILEFKIYGTLIKINNEDDFWLPLPCMYNVYNQLAVYAAAVLLGADKEEVKVALSAVKGAKGRFELVPNNDGKNVVVDYAHTPDALENVLSAVKELTEDSRRVICVFGAGGDRDTTKRPEMGAVSVKYSDLVIITSDNPRSEEPNSIIDQIAAGIDAADMKKVMRIADRKEAINVAINLMQPDDVLVIAGKGHENYQEIKGVKHHFDDVEIVKELINR